MFDVDEFIQESIESLQNTIDDIAIIACSGGVDSTVAAVIANKAVGDLLHCVYVDTGFMRKGETEQIETLLAEQGIKNLVTVKAADRYFEALEGVTEPEQKRKVIGELFIRIFEDEQKKLIESLRKVNNYEEKYLINTFHGKVDNWTLKEVVSGHIAFHLNQFGVY